jgi:PAS domain S-box-containing protein
MRTLPLRKILSVQFILISALPFLLSALVGGLWLSRTIESQVRSQLHQMAEAISTQVERSVQGAFIQIQSVGRIITNSDLNDHDINHVLDSILNTDTAFKSLYVTDQTGRVLTAGISATHRDQRQDLIGLDLSQNPVVREASRGTQVVWSDTYLSPVAGELVVAIAFPVADRIVMGEFSLASLSSHLERISREYELFTSILDRRGQIIADAAGQYTAQQLNISNLPLVSRGLASRTRITQTMTFENRTYMGSIMPIPDLDWLVLVAQPETIAYRPLTDLYRITGASTLITILVGIVLSFLLARRLASRFEALANHAHQVGIGDETGHWPPTNITEFRDLSCSLQVMADSIRERERQMASLMSNLPGMVYSCEPDSEHSLIFVSDMCNTLLGRSSSDLLRKPSTSLLSFVHPDDRQGLIREIRESASSDRPFSTTHRVLSVTGEITWVLDQGGYTFDAQERSRLEGVMLNITEQKKAEAESQKLEEQLRQSQKMESIGLLAGGVAHDFNNLLQVINGYTGLMLDETRDNEKLCRKIKEVSKAGERARTLVSQMLAFSRRHILEPHELDLNEVVQESVRFLKRLIGEHILVEVQPCAERAVIYADRGMIEQIIMNLCVNARDAMPGGGTLTLATDIRSLDDQEVESYRLDAAGPYVELRIADSGCGMNAETLSHIFEPFFTTKEVGKGTGLGLAMVYGLVQQHKGSISVSSQPGEGTTFQVFFPRSEEKSGNVPQKLAEDKIVGGTETILLGEDDEMVRNYTQSILERAGYTVLVAKNGLEAVDYFRATQDCVDLILLDVVMPQMGGFEASQEIQKIRPGIKIVFVSGYNETPLHNQFTLDSNTILIQKPFVKKDILGKIRGVLDTR